MHREITPGVFDITCTERPTGRIRAFLFDDGTLVDTGLSHTADALLAGIEATGVTPERVIITHTDGDHVGGVRAVVEAHGTAVYAPEGANTSDLSDSVNRYRDGDVVGGFIAVHVPGHRTHMHALVDESRADGRGVAVLADALSGADQRGLPAGYFHLPPAVYTDDLNLAEESLEKLLAYTFDVGLVYHGSSVLTGASERLADYVFSP